jgi:hypothetical protein
MQRTNIHLDEEQLRVLEQLAAENRQSVAEIVREAVDEYLAKRVGDGRVWRDRLDALLDRVQSRIPGDTAPDEIEADITAARDEVRRAHRAARRH